MWKQPLFEWRRIQEELAPVWAEMLFRSYCCQVIQSAAMINDSVCLFLFPECILHCDFFPPQKNVMTTCQSIYTNQCHPTYCFRWFPALTACVQNSCLQRKRKVTVTQFLFAQELRPKITKTHVTNRKKQVTSQDFQYLYSILYTIYYSLFLFWKNVWQPNPRNLHSHSTIQAHYV